MLLNPDPPPDGGDRARAKVHASSGRRTVLSPPATAVVLLPAAALASGAEEPGQASDVPTGSALGEEIDLSLSAPSANAAATGRATGRGAGAGGAAPWTANAPSTVTAAMDALRGSLQGFSGLGSPDRDEVPPTAENALPPDLSWAAGDTAPAAEGRATPALATLARKLAQRGAKCSAKDKNVPCEESTTQPSATGSPPPEVSPPPPRFNSSDVAAPNAAGPVLGSFAKKGEGKLKWRRRRRTARPRWIAALLISAAVLVAAVLLALLLFPPVLIQRSLDGTLLFLEAVELFDPHGYASFGLTVHTRLTRPDRTPAEMKAFTASVFWEDSGGGEHDFGGLGLRPGDAEASQAVTILPPLLRTEGEDGLNKRVTAGSSRRLLGEMLIPEMHVVGVENEVRYTTVFRILDADAFAAFLRSFASRGSADWRLEGSPSVRAMGLTYHNFKFDKLLELRGPALGARDARPTEGIKITSFDLTASSASEVVLQLNARMQQGESRATINPLGVLGVDVRYRGVPMLRLRSTAPVTLRPGANDLAFVGTVPALDDPALGALERDAIIALFRHLLTGGSPELLIAGESCSVPLFAPAVQQLRSTVKLAPFAAVGAAPDDDGSAAPKFPVLHDMRIVEMEVQFPPPTAGSGTGIRGSDTVDLVGRVRAIIFNPLGASSPLRIPKISLGGRLTAGESGYLGEFRGELTSDAWSRPVSNELSQIGTMWGSLQAVEFAMRLRLALHERGENFKAFMRRYLDNESVHLGMVQVKATLDTESALGPLTMPGVPLERWFQLVGFNKMAGVKLENFAVESLPIFTMLTRPEKADGGVITAKVRVPNPTATVVHLGTLNIELLYKGHHMLYLSAPNCSIRPGTDNVFDFRGLLRLNEVHVPSLIAMVGGYVSGRKDNVVTVRFVATVPPAPRADSPLGPGAAEEGAEDEAAYGETAFGSTGGSTDVIYEGDAAAADAAAADAAGEGLSPDFIKAAIIGREIVMPFVRATSRNTVVVEQRGARPEGRLNPRLNPAFGAGSEGGDDEDEIIEGMGAVEPGPQRAVPGPGRARGRGPLGLGLLPGLLGARGGLKSNLRQLSENTLADKQPLLAALQQVI